MKILKYAIFFILFIFLITGCGDKEQPKQQSPQQTQTETKPVSNIKFFKMTGFEKSTSKNTPPEFNWEEEGKKISITDFKGKVVFINFWATWCGPCKAEMPSLSKINEELKDKNFIMLGINLPEGSKIKAEDYLNTNPVSYTIIDANGQFFQAFADAAGASSEAIPTSFIINKEGKIAETIVGARDHETFKKIINKYLD